MKKLLSLFAVVTAILLVGACAPKKEKERIGRGSRSGLQTDRYGQPDGLGPGIRGWQLLESGRVGIAGLRNNQSSSQADAIDELVSSFIDITDRDQYGRVAESGAISIGAKLAMNQSCQIDAGNSLMGIVIFDGIALANPGKVIRIYMGPERASISSAIVNGKCVVKFSDDYGSITLHLSIGSAVTGDVTFLNKSSTVSHFATGRETYLGTIYPAIPSNQILF